jgi:iron(III) transport system substrate-binding protein
MRNDIAIDALQTSKSFRRRGRWENLPMIAIFNPLFRVAGAVALLLAMMASAALAADSKTVANIANYTAADRQTFLEAGARKEGELLVYAVGSQIDPLIKAFGAKYPFLSVKVFKADIPHLLKKVTEEYRANVFNADAYELDDYGLAILRDARMLAPFQSPEMANYSSDAIEPGKHWVFMREDYASLGFNTDAYSSGEVPQKHADLLDPKWKGKLGISATASTLTMWVGTMVVSEGEDFVRKLGHQQMRLYNLGGPAVANLVVSGEAPLVVNNRRSHMYVRKNAGGHVGWRAIGPSYTAVSGVALASRSNHPHAAMLFNDFMLSAEGQKIYTTKLGYTSLRKEMIGNAAEIKKVYLARRPNYRRDYEQWSRLADQVFKSGL